MGSFNGTDGITQLPIEYGDRVRAFILLNYQVRDEVSFYGGGFSYSNTIWSPMGCVQGTYNDYGSVESIKDDISCKILLEDLRQYNPSISIEDAFERIKSQENILYKYIGKTNLGMMLVLEDVYQTMINYNPIMLSPQTNLYRPFHDNVKADIYDWYVNTFEKYMASKDDSVKQISVFLMSKDSTQFFWDLRNRFTSIYFNYLQSCIIQGKDVTSNEVSEALQSLFEIIVFNEAMEASRKFWSPQSGAGSQDGEFDIYNALAKTILKYSDAKQTQRIEEYDAEMPYENGYYKYMLEHNERVLKNGNK